MIEKSAIGVYILPEVWADEIFNLQNRFKRRFYSHEVALFLWNLTDRTPNRYRMAFIYNSIMTGLTEALEDAGSKERIKKTGSLCDTCKSL